MAIYVLRIVWQKETSKKLKGGCFVISIYLYTYVFLEINVECILVLTSSHLRTNVSTDVWWHSANIVFCLFPYWLNISNGHNGIKPFKCVVTFELWYPYHQRTDCSFIILISNNLIYSEKARNLHRRCSKDQTIKFCGPLRIHEL